MRIVLILAVILAALTGGYFYQWQKQAEVLKALATSRIEALNAGPEAEGFEISLSYKDMNVGGFPFSHRITLVSPVLESNYSLAGIHSLIREGGEAAVAPGEKEPLVSTLSLDGDLSLSINYLSTSTDFIMNGGLTGEDTLMGDSLRWKMERAGPVTCSVDFRSSAMTPMFRTFVLGKPMEGEELLKHLDSLSCAAGEQRIIRQDDQQPLANLSASTFTVKDIIINGEGGENRLHFIADMPKMEAYDAYQGFYGSFGSGVRPSEYKLSPLKSFELVGAQSLAIDVLFRMQKPDGLSSPGQPKNILLDMKQFKMANKLWQFDYPLYLSVDDQSDGVNFVVRYHGKGKIEPAFDMAAQEALSGENFDPSLESSLAIAFPEAEPEEVRSFISDLLPRASGFGNFSMDVDMEGSAATQGGLPSGAGGITVRALNFLSDVYSLKMQGSYEAGKNEGMLTIDCLQCEKLVADAVEYNNRVQKAYGSVNPSHMAMTITTEMYESIMTFLKGLNIGKSEDDITISVVSNGQGSVTISNKPMLEVMMQAMQVMQPAPAGLPQP